MPQHILVVEDERHLGVGIKYNLEAEGYRVTLVEDGPTGLKILSANPGGIHLVVLDLMLPGMSGYAVCESIRMTDPQLPVLMLSARTLPEDRTRGFDVGANQYMSKPFDLDELLSRIKNLLKIPRGDEAKEPLPLPHRNIAPLKQAHFGDVEVDFETHVVVARGEEVKMTPKELRLLQYFLQNPDRVISRAELLTEVWEMNGNVQTRAVDQFIARIRKVIEPDTTKPVHLLTIRDAGYRFIVSPNESPE